MASSMKLFGNIAMATNCKESTSVFFFQVESEAIIKKLHELRLLEVFSDPQFSLVHYRKLGHYLSTLIYIQKTKLCNKKVYFVELCKKIENKAGGR